jgi:hypothetical protein
MRTVHSRGNDIADRVTDHYYKTGEILREVYCLKRDLRQELYDAINVEHRELLEKLSFLTM